MLLICFSYFKKTTDQTSATNRKTTKQYKARKSDQQCCCNRKSIEIIIIIQITKKVIRRKVKSEKKWTKGNTGQNEDKTWLEGDGLDRFRTWSRLDWLGWCMFGIKKWKTIQKNVHVYTYISIEFSRVNVHSPVMQTRRREISSSLWLENKIEVQT